MSTITPPAVLPAEDSELNERYKRLLHDYDNRAIRSKRWMWTFWYASMLLAWVPVLLAIAALAFGAPAGRFRSFMVAVLPWLAWINAVVALVQMLDVFRKSWLKYRAATERLRENCMLFRARLDKFCSEDAAKVFRAALDEMEEEIGDRRPFQLRDRVPWPVLVGLQPLPAKLRAPFDHSADKGLYPRCDEPETAETIVILQRLRNQQRWHLLKARWYSRRYLLLQVVIVFLWLTASVYHRWYGYEQLATLALLSMVALFLNAYRERLGHAQLCVRYTRIVETLEQIDRQYEAMNKDSTASAEQRLEWLRQTALRVERSLSSEFQYWYFGRENFGGACAR